MALIMSRVNNPNNINNEGTAELIQLNVEKSLERKLLAAKRIRNWVYKYTGGGLVIEADTATCELLKIPAIQYYNTHPTKQGLVRTNKSTDSTAKNTVQVRIRKAVKKIIDSKDLLNDITCVECETKAAPCDFGYHWIHNNCEKLTNDVIQILESDPTALHHYSDNTNVEHIPKYIGVNDISQKLNKKISKTFQNENNPRTTDHRQKETKLRKLEDELKIKEKAMKDNNGRYVRLETYIKR
ncbi:unnamed protein product [Mytilus coruscus]|uniref:Uncharacterized protein n=1 Tax=Mytilus coruscus TaxID=42192 RepID=A0A6J8CGM1_MYTCO|nr:unnamed protein product [Mytilus coruscus]